MAAEDPAVDPCADLDRRLAHVMERGMRLVVVREQLLACSPEEACVWLAHAVDRTPSSRSGSDRLRDAIVEVLMQSEDGAAKGGLEPLPYAFRRDLYAAAVAAGAGRLSGLLRSHPSESGEAPAPARRLAPEVAEIPLGVRRSLAKGTNPLLLEKLALDPDPVVIANLLRNPRIREAEVVRIAALRPVPPSTLQEVARSERWAKSARVRVALARNPYCPLALALKLVGSLPLSDLRAMRSDPDLAEETHCHVVAEILRRDVTPADPDPDPDA